MSLMHFITDIKGLEFDESTHSTWLQMFPLGKWTHPIYGEIVMTPKRIEGFIRNFDEKVRGTDIDIDYDHKDFGGKAAGWVLELADRGPDGLWGHVEWTPSAFASLKDREYKYFSPEFADKWTRPSDKKVFTDVLFGGAITNRPFLKEIQPINLSDLPGHYTEQGDEPVEELLKQLSEALGVKLSDDSDKDQEALVDAVKSLKEKADKPAPTPPPKEDDELKKLSESNPVIAKLLQDREEDKKILATLTAANRLSEVSRKLSDLNTDKVALPPAFMEEMRNALVTLSETSADKVIGAIQGLIKTGLVQLGEIGKKRTPATGDDDAVKSFTDAVEAMRKEDKELTYTEAVIRLAEEKPEMWAAYNDQQLQEVKTA